MSSGVHSFSSFTACAVVMRRARAIGATCCFTSTGKTVTAEKPPSILQDVPFGYCLLRTKSTGKIYVENLHTGDVFTNTKTPPSLNFCGWKPHISTFVPSTLLEDYYFAQRGRAPQKCRPAAIEMDHRADKTTKSQAATAVGLTC